MIDMIQGRLILEESSGNNVNYNLALEQSIITLQNYNNFDSIIRFWRNQNSVILGRNQDFFSEINIDYCKNNNIEIARRISGGGTVYQDLGNLNVSLIFNKNMLPNKFSNIKDITGYFTDFIIKSLECYGLNNLERKGTSNILYNELKISGSSGYYKKNCFLHHLTLLIDVNLVNLEKSLLARPNYEVKKGRESNYYKTTNISDNFNVTNWKSILIMMLEKEYNIRFIKSDLTESEVKYAKNLEKNMYESKNWIILQQRKEEFDFEV
ncbi:MAG: Lipoate-protein ligase A subunit 1 [Candidatus Heimdallarchaeota archaeon LC_3]|nr:MAG: Lipoate-protein ligase A subunit 1 [Candidatus Heimdallarchaeota archaeon LC_3]